MDVSIPHEEVVLQITHAWNAWLESIAGLDDAVMTRPGASGEWSPADLAFHIAFWDEQAGYDIQFRHDNNGDAPPRRDWQRMNELEHQAHAGRTPDEARRVMLDTHEALMLLVSAHDDDDLTWLVAELVDHYTEHTAEMRSWRAQ